MQQQAPAQRQAGAQRQAPAQRQAGAQRPSAPRGNELRARAAKLNRYRMMGVRASAAILAIGMVIGLLWFARPAQSTLEKRALEPFPQFTVGEFLDGTYTSNMSRWYSDTYPLRELMVSAGRAVSSLYGLQGGEKMVGGNVVADELPPVDEADKGSAAAQPATYVDEGPVETPDERAMAEEVQDSIMEGLYVKDGAAYNMYYFAQEPVERYAQAMNLCADKLDGTATVYSMLVPNNSGTKLDDDLLVALGGSDQRQAMRYFYSLYNDKVHPVFIYDELRAHRDEYTCFRTDHHWTQLGAYYAYRVFCAEKGFTPENLDDLEHKRFEPFLGSFYGELDDPEMAANPDYVDAWVPKGTNDLVYWDDDGEEINGNVITDTTDWPDNAKTSCFIEDRPLAKIVNPNITDDSACLLVKDSFGCFFASLLVDHYHTVWVIDPRHSDRNIPQFVKENNITDVLFLNNVTLASTEGISSALLSEIQG